MTTIIATPGDPSANSYCTLDEANAYHAGRLFNTAWTSADATLVQTPALIWACRLLDRQEWYGQKTSRTQALRWPRAYVVDQDGWAYMPNEIPQFLKNAQAELALLLVQTDRTLEAGTEGFSRIGAGSVSVDVNQFDRIKDISPEIERMISPFCNVGGATLMRG